MGQGVGALVFIASWVYCTFTYGFLLGFGLGWLPSIILGVIAAAIWPIAIVFLVVFCVPAFMALIGLAYVIMSWLH